MDPNKFQSASEFVSSLSKKARDLLMKWRDDNARNSELVREIWQSLNLSSYLGDEKWVVLEQVCLAAMDLQDRPLVESCLERLKDKFPNSGRVKRLRMLAKLELNQRYDDALIKYNELIANDEANSMLHKRKIAILIAAKKTTAAIRALCEYLKSFMNDHEAWIQLAELYIQEQEYSKAAFCVEELILSNPHNHLYHERYAEIQYTINTPESLELARAYFSQAVRLKPTSLRALYGLILTSNHLANSSKNSKNKKYQRLSQWAVQQISMIYKNTIGDNAEQQDLLESIDSTLEELSIAN
ncbi:ER membrane protein complex subunit 2 [Sarcoptes scabiei]|nr:ER membrane protein complex subunit 2 [Sarcoptes scabiei]